MINNRYFASKPAIFASFSVLALCGGYLAKNPVKLGNAPATNTAPLFTTAQGTDASADDWSPDIQSSVATTDLIKNLDEARRLQSDRPAIMVDVTYQGAKGPTDRLKAPVKWVQTYDACVTEAKTWARDIGPSEVVCSTTQVNHPVRFSATCDYNQAICLNGALDLKTSSPR